MVSTESETTVDVSPIVVRDIMVDGRRLVASEPLCYEVTFEDDDGESCFDLEGPFGIYLFAETREILIDMLHDVLEAMWRDFAVGDQEKITLDAQERGAEMRERFSGVARAS